MGILFFIVYLNLFFSGAILIKWIIEACGLTAFLRIFLVFYFFGGFYFARNSLPGFTDYQILGVKGLALSTEGIGTLLFRNRKYGVDTEEINHRLED
ncbi:hypothetical protein ACFL35_15695 [Candidatus Riflebacteria bacterium]